MDAAELQRGFHVGEWLVEPRASRASSSDAVRDLTADELGLLLMLAESHGEAVGRREIRNRLWPHQPGAEEHLRATVASLRQIFGDTPRQRRYIASVGQDALALVAHFRPAEAPAGAADASAVVGGARGAGNVGSRLHWLLGELRRRNVLKVTASYLVVTWIVLQVAQVTFAPLRFPDWWMTALTIFAIIGLPIVGVMAWAYEITPQGVVADSGVTAPGAVRLPRPRQSLAPVLVTGVALMAGVTGLAWWRSLASLQPPADAGVAEPEAGAKSIAVLPLVDMSPGGGNGWLGDGLSEELSTRLAQVPGLRVAARTSAFEFRGRNLDVRRIGQSLGVRHVLEGSVRRDGDEVRVTVQLIDSRTGYHLWAGNFDRAWRDVLDLQDDVARSVADALQVVLTDRADKAVAGGAGQAETLDARVIDPYLKGLALLRQPGDLSVLKRAEESFRAALDIAPEFAGAHAGLCRSLVRQFDQTRDRSLLEGAERACRRSLALDPSVVETERALAGLYASGGNVGEAIETYRKILAANPRDADAKLGLADALSALGRDQEAEAMFRQAVATEPSYWGTHSGLGVFLFQRGRMQEAIASHRRSVELVPSSAFAWNNLGGVLQLNGEVIEAERAFQHSLQLEPSKAAYSNVATAQFLAGKFADAVGNYERAVELGPHDQTVRGNLADALWQLPGRREDAVATYRIAIDLAEAELAATPGDPMLSAQLGYYYGRVGDPAQSKSHLDRALGAGASLLYVQYYSSVAALDRGDREVALEALAAMVRLGYPTKLLRSAPEFRSLLPDPKFKKIVGEDQTVSR